MLGTIGSTIAREAGALAFSPGLGAVVPGGGSSGERAGDLFQQVAPWLFVLVVVTILGWVVAMLIRRQFREPDSGDAPFTLDGLRSLRRQGKITDEEFERARQVIVAAVRRSLTRGSGGVGGKADGDVPSPGTAPRSSRRGGTGEQQRKRD